MFTLRAALLLATVSFVVGLPEEVVVAPPPKVGDVMLRKPNGGSAGPIQPRPPTNDSAALLKQTNSLELRQSRGCCDCLAEANGAVTTIISGGIDYGDNDLYTINAWVTYPYNYDGCRGTGYSAFNAYGLGYGRWGYEHDDIQFYLDNQWDVPGGARVIQWDQPVVDASKNILDYPYNAGLFHAYVLDASSYVVLDTCPCFARTGQVSAWECALPEACCFGGICRENLDFQCGPCYTLT